MAIQNSISNQALLTTSSPTFTAVSPGNLNLTGNTLSSTDTNGNLLLNPNGSGIVNVGAVGPTPGFGTIQVTKSAAVPVATLGCYSASATQAGTFLALKSSSTTVGSFSAVTNGDQLGKIQVYGDDGASFRLSAQILMTAGGAVSSGIVPGSIQFFTSNSSGVSTLGFTLTSAQAATFATSITATAGAITSGAAAGGFAGNFQAYSTGASLGSTSLTAANNAGNFTNILTNASTTAGRTWTLPDATGTLTALGNTSTGSGSVVLATSPTITTPVIDQINDANGNVALDLIANSSAVNYYTITNAATGNSPGISAIGADANIYFVANAKGDAGLIINTASVASAPITLYSGTGSQHITTLSAANTAANRSLVFPDASGTFLITGQAISTVPSIAFSSTSGVIGTATNDSAAAGSVGEISSSANATAVAMTTGTITQIQTLFLGAGDWDVWCTFYTTVNGATISQQITCQLHTTTATIADPTTAQLASIASAPGIEVTGQATYLSTGISRWSLSGATTVYLNAIATYSINTLTGNGMIHARRRR